MRAGIGLWSKLLGDMPWLATTGIFLRGQLNRFDRVNHRVKFQICSTARLCVARSLPRARGLSLPANAKATSFSSFRPRPNSAAQKRDPALKRGRDRAGGSVGAHAEALLRQFARDSSPWRLQCSSGHPLAS